MDTDIEVVHRQNAEHYTWGAVCDGWHLVKRPELSVIQESVPAGAGEVRHFHTRARQVFLVLSGVIELESGEAPCTCCGRRTRSRFRPGSRTS